jgi:hypothetical protein
MSGGPSHETLVKARKWCAAQFAKRYDRSSHASFLASEILKEADEKFALESHGVEGFCTRDGSGGCDYLNMGDSYTQTLYVKANRHSARFSVGCYAGAV